MTSEDEFAKQVESRYRISRFSAWGWNVDERKEDSISIVKRSSKADLVGRIRFVNKDGEICALATIESPGTGEYCRSRSYHDPWQGEISREIAGICEPYLEGPSVTNNRAILEIFRRYQY